MNEYISDMIKSLNKTVEILKIYDELMEKGDCNSCKLERSCQYCPKVGEVVRINCPLYVRPEGGVVKVVTPQKEITKNEN